MREVKKSLEWLLFYLLLLSVNILPCAGIIPHNFPTQNFSTIYLLILSVSLILYYSYRLAHPGRLKITIKFLSWMMLFLILLRGIKDSAFVGIDVLSRFTGYLFCVPILLISLSFFFISLFISVNEEQRLSRKWYFVPAITIILILLILTNDLHQPEFSWYKLGWVIYTAVIWQSLLYIISVKILISKCLVNVTKRNAWVIFIPFIAGIVLIMLYSTGNMIKINGNNIIEFPEILCFMAAGVLECCMRLGLIPTNEVYNRLFRVLFISSHITDHLESTIYTSDVTHFAQDQSYPENNTRIGKHSILHRMKIPGGFGFWQDDVTELDRLNTELADARNRLSEEAELTRLKNELKENQAKIRQRTIVYDTIAERTKSQSVAISRIAKEARLSSDKAFREKSRKHILLLGAYIKRYANLMLLSEDRKVIEVGELSISVAEVLRYLNLFGIPAELLNTAEGSVPADVAFTVFETFKVLLEESFSSISGLFANFSGNENIVFKLTLENHQAYIPKFMEEKLSETGVRFTVEYEDNVTYIGFTFPEVI